MFTSTAYDMPPKKEEHQALTIPLRRIFAKNSRKARRMADLTQRDLAKKTGLTQAFISRVENSETTLSIDNAAIIAEAVGKPLHKLLNPKQNDD